MPYVPPWIQPADPAGQYAKGYALGQRDLEGARQAFAEQAQQAARASEQAQRAALAQAEIAQETERQRQAAEVAHEELRIKQQAQALKDRAAAMRFAAAKGLQADIEAGMEFPKAILRNPELWAGSPQSTASAMRLGMPVPTDQPFVPTGEATPITFQGKTIGAFAPTSRQSGRIMTGTEIGGERPLNINQAIAIARLKLSDINQQLQTVPDPETEKALNAQKKQIMDDIDLLVSGEKQVKKQVKKQGPAVAGGTATVKTKAEYDELPSGATYIGSNGKKYRKP